MTNESRFSAPACTSVFCLLVLWGLSASLLTGCAGPPPAPVEDRSVTADYSLTPDGYYRVRRGDSLYGIAFRYGLDWRDLAAWNDIASPYVIHPNQLLRLELASSRGVLPADPASDTEDRSVVRTAGAPAASRSTTRPLKTPQSSDVEVEKSVQNASDPEQPSPPPEPESQSRQSIGSQSPSGATTSLPVGDPDRWLWPTDGRLMSSFRGDDPARKGIDIGGQAGQAVIASADGQVVYSGSGLIGYGELIIIKHSDRMLSAYAHNSKRLVSEGQHVSAGSKIAEMGTNDRNQALLHFEIRVQGNPEDPVKYLPRR